MPSRPDPDPLWHTKFTVPYFRSIWAGSALEYIRLEIHAVDTMTSSSSITTLFLDNSGVLMTNGWDYNMSIRAADNIGLDYDEMNECHHLNVDTYEEGKLSLDEYLN